MKIFENTQTCVASTAQLRAERWSSLGQKTQISACKSIKAQASPFITALCKNLTRFSGWGEYSYDNKNNKNKNLIIIK
jgi:hypothetical protein